MKGHGYSKNKTTELFQIFRKVLSYCDGELKWASSATIVEMTLVDESTFSVMNFLLVQSALARTVAALIKNNSLHFLRTSRRYAARAKKGAVQFSRSQVSLHALRVCLSHVGIQFRIEVTFGL